MTREEQIDWLCRLRADLNNGIIFTPWNKEFTEALNDFLEQEPKAEWVPVSERLPETNHDVLATDGTEMYVAWYSRNSIQIGWISSDDSIDRYKPIKAWMPLPKDYEPQESNEKCKKCKYYLNPDYTRCHECKVESEGTRDES